MKTITQEEFQAAPDRYLREVQDEAIVITQCGKPRAVLHGIPDDLESAELAHSREFWTMIESRRKEKKIPWSEVKASLGE